MVLRLVSGPMLEKSNRTRALADRQKVLLTIKLKVFLFLGCSTTRETGNFFELDYFDIFLIFSISSLIFGSFYFTENFLLPKFENRGCTTGNFPYGSPPVKIAQREPKNGYATTIFKLQ